MFKIKHLLGLAIVVCVLIAVWQFSSAIWIYGKAYAAKFLINDAWQKTLLDKASHKPWSWADTWPVAEIKIPAIGLNEIVLAGDSGATLAFAPGLSNAGAALDSPGVKLISAHRDTHFSKLKDIGIDDDIFVKTSSGNKRYKVIDTKVVDSRSYTIDAAINDYDLVLATCYPFVSVVAAGVERFIVEAKEFDEIQRDEMSYSDVAVERGRFEF